MTGVRVWERTFATEEEADVVYDRMLTAEEHKLPFMIVEVERFDGHTVRVDYMTTGLDKLAHKIEATYSPPQPETVCTCGHQLAIHNSQIEDDPCERCPCDAFERADWPPDGWGEKGEQENG